MELDEHFVHHLCHEPTRMCRKCLMHFGAAHLNKDKEKPDGLNNICLDCHQINMRKRRDRNRESRKNIKDWYANDLMSHRPQKKGKSSKQIIEYKKLHLINVRKLREGK